ncbi:ribosomal RNA-processing protein 8 [Hylaeus anthracinus]|uniref:ribosomal RNA-processing protein 8 n=1 Tax=Hylaeus anthracinus TaxID=313031 RepID=UPI0023B98A48|nr:ribosomal RNA-processing protein 8 [Hylaeus anthracinus]
MGKSITKNASNTKNSGSNVLKRKKQGGVKKHKYKSTIGESKSLISNDKFKKNTQKLQNKFKQVHKNGKNHTSSGLVDSDIINVVKLENRTQIKKPKFHNKSKTIQQSNQTKKYKPKKHVDQILDQSNRKDDNNRQSNKKRTKQQTFNVNKDQNFKRTKYKKKKQLKAECGTVKVNRVLQKKVKHKEQEQPHDIPQEKSTNARMVKNHNNLNIKRLEEMLAVKQREVKIEKKNEKPLSLRERMMTKLKASRFRYLNETLYNGESSESKKYFKDDPDAFRAYHEGYKQQVEQWPLNPLDIIISSIKKMPKEYVIADFGCGEATLAASIPHKVHSFDFVSLNENVTACDVAHTPLLTSGVHVVVFCLSLMGTNLKDYIVEANRVLKKDGILKIAEVESRFEHVEDFIKVLSNYGFKNTWKDLSHNLFYFLDFKKEKDIGGKKSKFPPLTLKPCLYKKR